MCFRHSRPVRRDSPMSPSTPLPYRDKKAAQWRGNQNTIHATAADTPRQTNGAPTLRKSQTHTKTSLHCISVSLTSLKRATRLNESKRWSMAGICVCSEFVVEQVSVARSRHQPRPCQHGFVFREAQVVEKLGNDVVEPEVVPHQLTQREIWGLCQKQSVQKYFWATSGAASVFSVRWSGKQGLIFAVNAPHEPVLATPTENQRRTVFSLPTVYSAIQKRDRERDTAPTWWPLETPHDTTTVPNDPGIIELLHKTESTST